MDFHGTMPTRVGRTSYTYDAAGRVTQTVTKRINKKPLVKHFYYATGGQPIGFDTSDEPGVGYRYIYDGLDRRVAKERVDTTTDEVLSRTVFAHVGNQLVAEQTTLGNNRGTGYVWTHDPATGDITGQITLTTNELSGGSDTHSDFSRWSQDQVDAVFFALVADLAGAPHEIIDPATGEIVGHASQTLYGKRTWRGEQSSPLLFAGQYYDEESGWAYNRYRYYHPLAGVYNAQDPLGAAPRVASAQGYVDHAAIIVDRLGLHSYAHVGKTDGGPGQWTRVHEVMSDPSRKYQEQVTGIKDGVGYKVNGVKFDSFENGVLVESKGPGYEKFLEKDRSGWRSWFRGGDDMTDQAVRQVRAANGTPIEWRVAEARVADKLTAQFARENLPIQVRHIKAAFS